MPKFREDEEKDAIDNVTNAMLSVGFLADISDFIFSTNRNSLAVGLFYDKWINDVSPRQLKIPLSPGIILGLMYVAIVYGKEWWYDIIPNIDIKDADGDWGIKHATFKFSKKPNPTFRDILRRLRNSLGHGNTKFIIPRGVKQEALFDKVKIQFHDENPRDCSDTFDTTLTLNECFKFIKKFQSFIHRYVRNKYVITRNH